MVGDGLREHHEHLLPGPRDRAASGGTTHRYRARWLRPHFGVAFHPFMMQRHRSIPRPGWREKVEEVGLTYHSNEAGPYWDESAAYELDRKSTRLNSSH